MSDFRVTSWRRRTVGAPDVWTMQVEDVSEDEPRRLGCRHRRELCDPRSLVREVVPRAVIDSVTTRFVLTRDAMPGVCRRDIAMVLAACGVPS